MQGAIDKNKEKNFSILFESQNLKNTFSVLFFIYFLSFCLCVSRTKSHWSKRCYDAVTWMEHKEKRDRYPFDAWIIRLMKQIIWRDFSTPSNGLPFSLFFSQVFSFLVSSFSFSIACDDIFIFLRLSLSCFALYALLLVSSVSFDLLFHFIRFCLKSMWFPFNIALNANNNNKIIQRKASLGDTRWYCYHCYQREENKKKMWWLSSNRIFATKQNTTEIKWQ